METPLTREAATNEAREIANKDNIVMAVIFNPYHESAESDDEKYGYHPLAALPIFHHHKLIETVHPAKKKRGK